MITVTKNEIKIVKIQLNQDKVNSDAEVVINFTSPSRTSIQLTKSLTVISSGFYSFSLTDLDASQFVDDTYSYSVTQDDVELKVGYVRLVTGSGLFGLAFEYTLDFTLS